MCGREQPGERVGWSLRVVREASEEVRPEGGELRGSKKRTDDTKALRQERPWCVQEEQGGLCGWSRKGWR